MYYKTLGEKALQQLEPSQIFYTENPETINSIAVIIKHLHGNMLSRWTDFLTTDGEKSWRDREGEFEDNFNNYEEVMKLWHEGWGCLLAALDNLKTEQLTDIIYIRNEGHTVLEAINRQLAHYPMHVGQIIFLQNNLRRENGKAYPFKKGNQNLIIPKNLRKKKRSKTLLTTN